MGSRTTRSTRSSNRVGWALTITTQAPCATAISVSPATGHLQRRADGEEEDVMIRGRDEAAASTRSSKPSWPKLTVADFRMPPHQARGSGSPAATRSRALRIVVQS